MRISDVIYAAELLGRLKRSLKRRDIVCKMTHDFPLAANSEINILFLFEPPFFISTCRPIPKDSIFFLPYLRPTDRPPLSGPFGMLV